MTKYRRVVHVESGQILLPKSRWCDNFITKLQGFTFQRKLTLEDGLVLVEKADNRVNASITMLFVFFDLGIIWVNSGCEIVDIIVAKSWRPSYAPQHPARYVIELHPDHLNRVKVGDHVQFLEIK